MKLRKTSIAISLLLSLSLLSACAVQEPTVNTAVSSPKAVLSQSADAGSAFSVELPENAKSDFTVLTEDGKFSYDEAANTYTFLSGGSYDCYGALYEGQLIVSADEDSELVINLNGCTITSSQAAPVYIQSAGEVDISAKKDTDNLICDLRSASTDEDANGGAVYAECDLTLKGNGALQVISSYNNGVHTKKDLKIKNLTLSVSAVNNALKGNYSVCIESGTVLAVSSGGDAIKSTATELSKNGNQRGRVEILGGSTALYAACDGIDAASDVLISGDAVLEIYTDVYSPYSGDVMTSSGSDIYLRVNAAEYSAGYKYSAYFYNSDGSFVWKDLDFYKEATASFSPMGRGGKGHFGAAAGTSYYYYSVKAPSGYTNVIFYAYSSAQSQGQDLDYLAVSNSDTSLSASWDTYAVSSITNGIISSTGWTSYQSSLGNTGLAYSCKGIKAGNTISIEGGTVTIQSKDDALHANFDSILESTSQKALGNIYISGGMLTLSSDDDGIHADQDLSISGGTVNVLTSYEGLEANRIYISGGSVTAYARDDGFNANSKGAYSAYIEISGAYIDVSVPSGDTDTIDSNGTVLISGGFVFLKNGQTSGSSRTGGTFDTERGVSVTGGTVIAIGCIGESISGATYSTSMSFSSGNYEIKDSADTPIASFELSSSYRACMFWSDAFKSGETYTLYLDDTALGNFTR